MLYQVVVILGLMMACTAVEADQIEDQLAPYEKLVQGFCKDDRAGSIVSGDAKEFCRKALKIASTTSVRIRLPTTTTTTEVPATVTSRAPASATPTEQDCILTIAWILIGGFLALIVFAVVRLLILRCIRRIINNALHGTKTSNPTICVYEVFA